MSTHNSEQDAAEFDHEREQGNALTRSPEHANEYIYEPLPGDRWIRVLILEPASELACPLVARLELLALGPALPMAPQKPLGYGSRFESPDDKQFDSYVSLVQASRLPYTAVSYSWAMDDGDDSPSRVLTLHGKKVSITQNLSEGLRRIRYKTDSRWLWVDALCIDQHNTAERSAQVAMMTDIFELAERCIVWLGEDIVRDNDLAVWQLSHCIVPNDNPRAFNKCFGSRNGNAAIVVLNALMAVDHSRCTMHACSERHNRIDDADFAGELFHIDVGENEFSDKTLKEFWQYMLAAPPEAVARKLSGIKLWLERRYWQRRWVVQESASRNRSSGATDYCWAEFSLGRIEMQNMLWLLSSIDVAVGSFFDVRFRAVDALRMTEAGTGPPKDLCDQLNIHGHLQCSDDRDRLYSLVSLDPGYGVQVDYALPMREVCIEFSRLMVRRGEVKRLLEACRYQRGAALNLPSWVVDLREYRYFDPRFVRCTTVHGSVSANGQLLLELNLLGPIVGMEKVTEEHPHGPITKFFLLFKPDGLSFLWRRRRARPTALRMPWLYTRDGRSPRKADALYCFQDGLDMQILLLRPPNKKLAMYRIIDQHICFDLYSADEYEIIGRHTYILREDYLETVHIG
ncbi:hypothetical protein CB0940_09865 [Cercospora beticola]|uniref:Heterokaryon incompatibility domain-containing protein n=1 Tax=Cercospora beticola TaxID=122368 RepID=A0A2G5HI82_CERBT|nr:hypothetical protein CB0940_09865 [Cercospora beticola]PIA92274.1 hypothetical protein CB0940_09865 [Cercospora beticola]WPB05787.1 hypothetical protein RHO25_010441 [Cercospora beticola]